MQFRRPLILYAIGTLLAGLFIAGLCLSSYPLGGGLGQWLLFAALVILTAGSQYFGLHLRSGLRVYVDTIPLFAALFLFNPAMAVLAAGLGYALGRLPQRNLMLLERVFNLGETLIEFGLGALVLRLFTATPWRPTSVQAWAGLVVTIIIMHLVNNALIAGIVGFQQRVNPVRFWLCSLPEDLLEQTVMIAFGLLMVLIVQVYPWALLLVVAPAIAVFITLERTLATEARHKQLAEQNAGLAAHLSEQAEQLREAYAVLEDAMDAKNQMLQNVSHELRTPLVSMYGYTEALQEGLYGELSQEQLPPMEIIYRNTGQMIRLVNDLLALQTMDRSQLQLTDVNLWDVFQNVAASFSQRFEAAGIDLYVECDDRIPLLHADGSRLEQVLGNLIDNAIKFSPNGGDVALRARSLDELTLEISVVDHGIGIPKDEVPRLYRRFYQVDGTTTRRFGGQGLGLAIARRIVELHGGGIRCESTVGEGTVFYLTLPVSVPASAFKVSDED